MSTRLCLLVLLVAALCGVAVSAVSVTHRNELSDGEDTTATPGRRGSSRRREWDEMHHMVRDLLAARVDPETGEGKALSERYQNTPLEVAKGIYTALGRAQYRSSKKNGRRKLTNKVRFNLKGLITSRLEDFSGKVEPGYMAPDVFQAELWLLKTPLRLQSLLPSGGMANLTVTSPIERGIVGQKIVSVHHNSWEKIDVTEFIRNAMVQPTRSVVFGFHAHSADPSHRTIRAQELLQLQDDRRSQRPVLVIYLREPIDPLEYLLAKVQEASDSMEARKKRSAPVPALAVPGQKKRQRRRSTADTGGPALSANNSADVDFFPEIREIRNDLCQLHSMYLDFETIGWDHIIAPVGFDPGMCHGECVNPLTKATNHAVVRSWAFRHQNAGISGGNQDPTVCCVPSTLSSMTLLIKEDEGEIVKSDLYWDMKATACGCH